MKKVLLLFITLLFVDSVNAQVLELIHAFRGLPDMNMEKVITDDIPDADCYYETHYDSSKDSVYFFVSNSDYSTRILKQVKLPNLTGGYVYSVLATKNILNDDDQYELFITYTRQQGNSVASTLYICDEKGNILQDVGNAYVWFPDAELHYTNGEYRLMINQYVLNSNRTLIKRTNVYRVLTKK